MVCVLCSNLCVSCSRLWIRVCWSCFKWHRRFVLCCLDELICFIFAGICSKMGSHLANLLELAGVVPLCLCLSLPVLSNLTSME